MKRDAITQAVESLCVKVSNLERDVVAFTAKQNRSYCEIGASMRSLREQRGVTLRALAKELHITPPFLSDMELGRRRYSAKHMAGTASVLAKLT